jgi:hypothetical protein
MNQYTTSNVKDGRFVVTKVVEEVILDLPIENAEGKATLTHIGAYKRIKFMFEGELYSSKNKTIALNAECSKVINIEKLSFDKDIETNWDRYVLTSGTEYWIEAK